MSQDRNIRRKIRVLYVITTLAIGGAEGQLVRLVTSLDRQRFEPAVCCLSSEGPYRETLDAAGIPVVTIGFTGFWGMRRDPGRVYRQISRLVGYIRDFHPDVVHGFLFWAYIMGTFAARLARVPIVVTSRRSLGYFKASERTHLFLEQIANRLTDVVVANSEAVRQDTILGEHLRPEKVLVIYNGIEADHFCKSPEERLEESVGLRNRGPVVGVIANLRHYKGHRYFFQAWAEVTKRFPGAVALLIGDGPDRSELEAQAESIGVSKSIRFLGSRRDIPQLLALMDLLVHPSLEEGFSNAILEAMAAGKPVVATAVGGNPEAVVHKATGLVVPPQDGHALAEAILWLMEHPDEAAAYGHAGQERVARNFDLQLMAREYERLYEDLVSKKRIG